MFILCADKSKLTVLEREPLTSGSVNVHTVRFEFSKDWERLAKTAVFRSGTTSVSVPLDNTGQCVIPWEVLTAHGRPLFAGVYGVMDGAVVLPTVWANCGAVLEGAVPGEDAREPALDVYGQILEKLAEKQDRLTGQTGQVVGFDQEGNPEAQYFPGGGDGVADHRLLTGRDSEDQHPIESISGLDEISNLEILKLWNGGT